MRIAIIGGGTCGLYLAWKLSKMGEKVTVFERKEKIGKEVCSGLFSERILEFIPHLSSATYTSRKSNTGQKGAGFIPQSQKLIQNKINLVSIHFPKRQIEVRFSKKFFVMSHFQLDNLLYGMAQNVGAKILLNHPLSNIANLKGFERIIGCDGTNSIVRKSLGLPKPTFRLGIQGFFPQTDDSNYVETWPTKNGFIWKIPRKNEIEYGIVEKPKGAKLLLENFLEKNNLSLEKLNSAIIPQGLIIPKNQKITLCGDAIGLTKPWSGGGVVWSLIAADLLLKNFPDFIEYQRELKEFFLPKIIFSKITNRLVYFFGFNFPWIFPKKMKIESDFLI